MGNIKLLIGIVLIIIGTGGLTKIGVDKSYESKFEEFQKSQAVRDSLILADSIAIRELQIERDSLISVRDDINYKLDSTISIIKKHSIITVTDNDVIEALTWIKETQGVDPTTE